MDSNKLFIIYFYGVIYVLILVFYIIMQFIHTISKGVISNIKYEILKGTKKKALK